MCLGRIGELQLRCEDDKGSFQAFQLSADPTGVDMDRVAAAMRVVGDVEAGRVTPDSAARVIDRISTAPPSPTWLFTLAAAAGAVALSVSHVAGRGLHPRKCGSRLMSPGEPSPFGRT